MKTSLVVSATLGLFLLSGGAYAARTNFAGEFSTNAELEAPKVGDHNPNGYVVATYDDATKRLCGRFVFNDTTGVLTGSHVHRPPVGMPDGDGTAEKIVIPPAAKVVDNENVITFNIALPEPWETSLKAKELYANLHTAMNPKGELRARMYEDTSGDPEEPCGEPTPVGGGGDAGADAAAPKGDASSGDPTSSSSGSPSGSSSGETSSSSGTGGLTAEPPAPKADDGGGCSTSGGGGNALSLAVLAGLGLAFCGARWRRSTGPSRG